MKQKLYIKLETVKYPLPVNAYRKDSIIGEIGFNERNALYIGGISETGYIIGVAYINNVIKTPTNIVKSLYFVVNEEIMIPKPIAIPPRTKIITGINNKQRLGSIIELD